MIGDDQQPGSPADIRARALAGVMTLTIRAIMSRGIAIVGGIVIARLLLPHQYGLLALGFAIYTFIAFLGSIGLGANLVRREAQPTRSELAFVMGVQIAWGCIATIILCVLISIWGESMLIAAIMVATMPLNALRVPAGIVLERQLTYEVITRVDVVASLVQTVASLVLVVVGTGPLGVAIASPLGALVGTALMWRLGPVGPMMPRLSAKRWKKMLLEGTWFVLSDAVSLVRDQGTNICVGALGGLSALGAWALVGRLLYPATFILGILWQVSFPAMARLRDQGEDMDHASIRSAALIAVGLGLPLAMIGGPAALVVHVLLSSRWSVVARILPLMCIAILLNGPISAALAGRLFAAGRAKRVVAAGIAHTVVTLAITASLFHAVGVAILGWATLASGFVDGATMLFAFRERVPILIAEARPTLAALAAGAVGWMLAHTVPSSLVGLFAVESTIMVTYLLGLLLLDRQNATMARTIILSHVRVRLRGVEA